MRAAGSNDLERDKYMMQQIIRIGSRESKLAVIQAELIRQQIQRAHPEVKTELITMKTTGDRILDRSLTAVGGKGLFVKELDRALLDGKIDLAVHSLKDMPMEISAELPILAYSRREDPRDALICKPGRHIFPADGVLGTSSQRRALQMRKLYPDCSFRSIRGNVQTRLRKLEEENYDGTILAAAGLRRLGMESVIGRLFSEEEMIPAAGQGILAVQGRRGEWGRPETGMTGNTAAMLPEWLECVMDRDSARAAQAERRFVRILDGGCTSPAAAHAQIRGNEIKLLGLYYEESSGEYWTDHIVGDADRAEQLGELLAERMKKRRT